MKSQTVISLKIEKDLKEAAQKLAETFGLPLGTMINAALRQIVRTQSFTLSTEKKPSHWLKKQIAQGKKEREDGQYKTAETLNELLEILK